MGSELRINFTVKNYTQQHSLFLYFLPVLKANKCQQRTGFPTELFGLQH